MRASESVTGRTSIMGLALRLAVVALHEDQLLEQRDVLLVLQQRTYQGRYGDLLVLRVQRARRDVFREQQLEPVDQLRGGRLLLQARQVAHVVEALERGGQQLLLDAGKV